MWRIAYSITLTILLPAILLRLWWRGKANPSYRLRVKERLGFYSLVAGPKRIWLHAVSVGEVNVAVPVIQKIIKHWPDYEVLVTTTTPTGADQVIKQLGDQVISRYIPYDIPILVKRALHQVNPEVLIIMETEIWPNFIHAAHERNIPIVYLNMRLSEKSFPGYQKIRRLIAPQLTKIDAIAAQTDADAKRVVSLGANASVVKVFGSIKYDVSLPEGVTERGLQLREQLGVSRPVWIAASTHNGEDEQVLSAHGRILKKYKDALLVLVPRHPERFENVFELASKHFATCKRTQTLQNFSGYQVYIGNTMGELFDLYTGSDVCFVGGSLVPHGGQNILEPWLIGRPVIVGPHTFNFAHIIGQALANSAIIQVNTTDELAQSVLELFDMPSRREELINNAKQLLNKNKGTLDKSVELLGQYL